MSLLDLLTKGLTKPGVASEAGTKFYDSPEAAAIGYAQQEANQLQPDTQQPTNVQIPTLEDNGQPVALGDSSGYSDQSSNEPAPVFIHPNFKQASTDQYGNQTVTPGLKKKGALMSILLGGARGAAIGSSQRNFGQGFEAAQENPIDMAIRRQALQRSGLENQMLGAQIGLLPWQRLATIAGLQKTQAETGKASAEGQKAAAEANAVPVETQLKQAQAEAANYKEDPNLGLIDLRTKQPVSDTATAPLTEDEANVLGKNPGDRVPLKLKNTANEMVNRGIRTVQANGRTYMVQGFGENAKKVDMGTANSIVGINVQQGPLAGRVNIPQGVTGEAALQNVDPILADTVKYYAGGNGDIRSYLSRLNPSSKTNFIALMHAYNPNFNEATFDVGKKVAEDFTSGADSNSLNAINRAREHMKVFLQTAKDLDNGNVQAFNKVAQAFGTEFGGDRATNLGIAKQAFSSEVGKAFAGANVGEGDRQEIGKRINEASSFTQLAGVARTADSLLAGAQKVLKQKYELGRKGQPNFGEQAAPAQDHSDIGFVPTGAGPH